MGISNINIHIKVKDFKRSRSFYKALGFKHLSSYGPDEEEKAPYHGARFEFGETIFEIADGHLGIKPQVFQEKVTSSKISLFLGVESIADMLAVCKKAGVEPIVGVRHYYWGKLEFVIRDPDGVILVFFAPYSEEEARKVQADETFATMLK